MLNLRPLPLLAALAALLSTTSCDVLWPSLCTFQPDHPGCNSKFEPLEVSLTKPTTVRVSTTNPAGYERQKEISLSLEQGENVYTVLADPAGTSALHFEFEGLPSRKFVSGKCKYTLSVGGAKFTQDCTIAPAGRDSPKRLSLSTESKTTHKITTLSDPKSGIIGLSQPAAGTTLLIANRYESGEYTLRIHEHIHDSTPHLSGDISSFSFQSPAHLGFTATNAGIFESRTAGQHLFYPINNKIIQNNSNAIDCKAPNFGSAVSAILAALHENNLEIISPSPSPKIATKDLGNTQIHCAVSIPRMPIIPPQTGNGDQDIYILADCMTQSAIKSATVNTMNLMIPDFTHLYTTRQRAQTVRAPMFAVLGRNTSSDPVHIIMYTNGVLISVSCNGQPRICTEHDLSLDIDISNLKSITTAQINNDSIDDIALIFKDRVDIYYSILVD